MPPCAPPFAISAAAMEARRLLPSLRDGGADAATVLAFCGALRVSAVGKLLLTGRPRELFADLERSGQAFAHFVARGGAVPTGLSRPFFDAVACGDTATAATIAGNTPRAFQRGKEYEDDFLHLRFLMDLASAPSRPAAEPLARWQTIAEGPDPRLDCCLALDVGDAAALDRALRAMVDADRTADAGLAAEGRLDPDEAVTTVHVHVEGLAIVRLATQRGIPVAGELPRVPSLARRVDLRTPLTADAWRHIEDLGFVA